MTQKMKLMECEKCGGNSFRKEGGVWFCQYCGASYIAYNGQQEKIDYYVMKAEEAFDKQKYNKMYDYSMKILAIEPEHSYAWLMQMYYYGMQGETRYTCDLIEAGKNAIRYEVEDLQDTRQRVNIAFVDLGYSGAFNANSHITIFYNSVLKDKKWEHPEKMTEEQRRKEYNHMPLSASSQLRAALDALTEVEEEFLTGKEFGEKFYVQDYHCDRYKAALEKCEKAIWFMKRSYSVSGFDRTNSFDYSFPEKKMEPLWQKIGVHRPTEETVADRCKKDIDPD